MLRVRLYGPPADNDETVTELATVLDVLDDLNLDVFLKDTQATRCGSPAIARAKCIEGQDAQSRRLIERALGDPSQNEAEGTKTRQDGAESDGEEA